jgi:hypothetical protein
LVENTSSAEFERVRQKVYQPISPSTDTHSLRYLIRDVVDEQVASVKADEGPAA